MDFLRNWDLAVTMGMMTNSVMGTGEHEDRIWEIMDSYRTVSAIMALPLFNKDEGSWLCICCLWNRSVLLVVARSGGLSLNLQSRAVWNWGELCNMAPTRNSHAKMSVGEAPAVHRESGKGVARRSKGTATRAQLHDQAATSFFTDRIPLAARKAIEIVEKDLWEQVKAMPIEEVRQEVEEWVVDPGSTAGWAAAYDRMIMLYWVIMNLVTHVSLSLEAKRAGDEESTKAWKDHNADCRLMHRKVDQIATHLGIHLYHPGMEQQQGGGSSRKASRRGADRASSLIPQLSENAMPASELPLPDLQP